MSTYLSQVWKLLINYVRGTRLQQMSKTASLETEAVLPLRKNIKEPDESLKFVQDYLPEYLLCEKLQKSIQKWTLTGKTENSNIDEKILSRELAGLCFAVSDRQLHEEIYNLLGEAALKPEIVNQLMALVVTDRKINPELLFWRLEDFYRRWCQGEFIDATPEDNLPQKKMLQLAAKNVAIGLRQVDIYTGLNVLILLLELHRYAQEQDRLKQKIIFYPSAQPDTDNFFTSELLRIVNYSDALAIGNFSTIIGQFLKSGNFIGAYLGDANLTGVDFSNANLSRAYLGDANLTGVNFCGANLTAANLGDANLSAANLSGANLSGADLSSANLSGANLSGANFSRADLSSANLTRANLKSADLNRADLSSTNLNCTDLSNAILFGANLSDANLSSANLSHADLCRSDLSGADLSHAILNGTNLSDTILFSTNLNSAILVAADLSYAKLNGAKLNNARLDGAMFLGADLSSTDLSRVTLNEADLSGVILNDADLSGADLTDAILFGTDLSYANLNNANLSGSNLSGAMLNGANLSHSNLSSAILGGADLSDANMEQMTWGQKQQWESVRGLDTAVNVPEALKEELGLK
ncbi:MAG: pentapeptide repeat-containing protein [Nostoc sp. ZfuVER08]|nr:pentapeptide repeat-containing protein [Nostoc sp. ZfuVER08]